MIFHVRYMTVVGGLLYCALPILGVFFSLYQVASLLFHLDICSTYSVYWPQPLRKSYVSISLFLPSIFLLGYSWMLVYLPISILCGDFSWGFWGGFPVYLMVLLLVKSINSVPEMVVSKWLYQCFLGVFGYFFPGVDCVCLPYIL